MSIAAWIERAARHGASDLHLETGLPVTLRVRGALHTLGPPIQPAEVQAMVRDAVGDARWGDFVERGSADLARVIAGMRCRINALHTQRGLGLAVRLLADGPVTLEALNLHPDLARLVEPAHGLVIVSGPTGSGKSSTLAALVQHINLNAARHIVTIEQPIEYDLRPARSFIRQREVGRHTPSFQQALLDSMREDIDVLMVGEMRERDTMRLTLDACETGHLVLTTLHSSSVVEAIQRLVSAFPAEEQPSVCAQLADVLVGVVSQGLQFRDELGHRVPECEVLVANSGVRSILRQGQFFKLTSAIQTGRADGMWPRALYREWLDRRTQWATPSDARPDLGLPDDAPSALPLEPHEGPATDVSAPGPPVDEPQPDDGSENVIVIEPEERRIADILSDLED